MGMLSGRGGETGSASHLLSAMAWFMPKFLGFVDSRWAPLLPAISVLFIHASGLVRYLRKRRA